MKRANTLLEIKERYGKRITIRVSLDHYSPTLHNLYRGKNAFEKALVGLRWLTQNGFNVCLAGRKFWQETEAALREGFARLCESEEIAVDATDPAQLILFPEMDETRDVPEITEACWSILNVDPSDMMCASSRMIVKRKGATHSVVRHARYCRMIRSSNSVEVWQKPHKTWRLITLIVLLSAFLVGVMWWLSVL